MGLASVSLSAQATRAGSGVASQRGPTLPPGVRVRHCSPQLVTWPSEGAGPRRLRSGDGRIGGARGCLSVLAPAPGSAGLGFHSETPYPTHQVASEGLFPFPGLSLLPTPDLGPLGRPLTLSHPTFHPTGLAAPFFPCGRSQNCYQPIRSPGGWQRGADCPMQRA